LWAVTCRHQHRLTREYLAALKKAAPDAVPSYVSFEGYVNGRVSGGRSGPGGRRFHREQLVDALNSTPTLTWDGMKISFPRKPSGDPMRFI